MRNYRHTAKGLAVVAALTFLLIPTSGLAEDNPVVGTWRLKSFVREIVGTGERYNVNIRKASSAIRVTVACMQFS